MEAITHPPHGATRVAVVDDEEILLSGVESWLEQAGPGLELVATAQSVADLLDGPGRSAMVVLLDLRLRDGISIADNIRDIVTAGLVVVACSSRDDPTLIREAISSGAHSYIRKSRDSSEARKAIEAANAGIPYTSRAHATAMAADHEPNRPRLSTREREALRLYASGLTMGSVARRLKISEGTAKGYLDRVRAKYDSVGRPARTKVELHERATEDGILPGPSLPVGLDAG